MAAQRHNADGDADICQHQAADARKGWRGGRRYAGGGEDRRTIPVLLAVSNLTQSGGEAGVGRQRGEEKGLRPPAPPQAMAGKA